VSGPHRYEVELRWSGSTGLGWKSYDRTHAATAPPAEQVVGLTTGEAHGNAAVLNPEQLLVMAASSCQMLWFLHLAAKARVDVVEYEDAATGLMPTDVEPTRVTEITLRPRIVVASETTEARVRKLLHTAHEHCYIANSLTSSVAIEPDIQLRPS
jgi:organic hydroperoxide reductase OsmC/OhrA